MAQESKKNNELYKGHRERLREKFLSTDCEDIDDSRLLELLLTYAIARVDVYPIAKRLLAEFGDLSSIFDANVDRLCEIEGVGSSTAVLIKLVPSLIAKSVLARSKKKRYDEFNDIIALAVDKFFGLQVERALALTFDAKMRLVAATWISKPCPNECSIDEAELARAFCQDNVSKAVIVHNHPGGRKIPSAVDRMSFDMIHNFADELHIEILDMLIVVGRDCYSASKLNGEYVYEYFELDEEMTSYLPDEIFEDQTGNKL